MTRQIVRLWDGDLGLGAAFWEYAVLYGSLLNLLTAVLSFSVLAANGPVALAVFLHFMALPYNIAAVVGVWRSAERYGGPAARASLARVAVVGWAVLATLL